MPEALVGRRLSGWLWRRYSLEELTEAVACVERSYPDPRKIISLHKLVIAYFQAKDEGRPWVDRRTERRSPTMAVGAGKNSLDGDMVPVAQGQEAPTLPEAWQRIRAAVALPRAALAYLDSLAVAEEEGRLVLTGNPFLVASFHEGCEAAVRAALAEVAPGMILDVRTEGS